MESTDLIAVPDTARQLEKTFIKHYKNEASTKILEMVPDERGSTTKCPADGNE